MARNTEVHGPWRIEGGHPGGPEHVGSVMSIDADGVVDPTGETVPAVARRAVCSCGWSGPPHDAPRAEGALIVRRYRKQSREELASQWRTHVAEWVPAPLDSPDGGEEGTGQGRPPRQKRPSGAAGEQMAPPPVPDPLAELGAVVLRAHAAAHEARAANTALAAAARAARQSGASWATIGAVTGVSRQAAHERWRSVT
ncbi:hypothetical protein [Pseudonocardia sp. ICBG601]|uniref:hypothetical protein n=1 Tax=Pseudonocardia sp. ICBG601 TaxID=2846759 RepID=UPI001CF6DD08|nr:hypothetical protein [Pseudonocardia sp. ICBG601]